MSAGLAMPRWSYLSSSTYDFNRMIGVANCTAPGPLRDNLQATLAAGRFAGEASLASGQAVAGSVQHAEQAITGAIDQQGQAVTQAINTQTAVSALGSLLTVGAIAATAWHLGRKADAIQGSIERLGAHFSEGLALVAARIESQSGMLASVNDALGRIHATLKTPQATRAAELRDQGLTRLSRGLWPEALAAFRQSLALEETDPVAHQMTGRILLDAVDQDVNLHDAVAAETHLGKAIRYAKAYADQDAGLLTVLHESLLLRATALLAQAQRRRLAGDLAQERELLGRARTDLTRTVQERPTMRQASYLLVKIGLFLDEPQGEAFARLVGEDPLFLGTALADADFRTPSGEACISTAEPVWRQAVAERTARVVELLTQAQRVQADIPQDTIEGVLSHHHLTLATVADAAAIPARSGADQSRPLTTTLELVAAALDEALQCEHNELMAGLATRSETLARRAEGLDADFCDDTWLKGRSLRALAPQSIRALPSTAGARQAVAALDALESDLALVERRSVAVRRAYEAALAAALGGQVAGPPPAKKANLMQIGCLGSLAGLGLCFIIPPLGGLALVICLVIFVIGAISRGSRAAYRTIAGTPAERAVADLEARLHQLGESRACIDRLGRRLGAEVAERAV